MYILYLYPFFLKEGYPRWLIKLVYSISQISSYFNLSNCKPLYFNTATTLLILFIKI